MKGRVTKKAQREADFKEKLYDTLRDLRMQKIRPEGTAVGQLGQELTVVYDRIVAAFREGQR